MRRWAWIMSLVMIAITLHAIRASLRLAGAQAENPVREMHMVEVLTKDAERVYTVSIPADKNPGTLHDQVVTVKLCPEGDDLPLKTGMVMEPFQYHQKLDCLLIDRSTFIDYLRDARRNVIDKHGNQLFD